MAVQLQEDEGGASNTPVQRFEATLPPILTMRLRIEGEEDAFAHWASRCCSARFLIEFLPVSLTNNNIQSREFGYIQQFTLNNHRFSVVFASGLSQGIWCKFSLATRPECV